jgi:hypothetical protein
MLRDSGLLYDENVSHNKSLSKSSNSKKQIHTTPNNPKNNSVSIPTLAQFELAIEVLRGGHHMIQDLTPSNTTSTSTNSAIHKTNIPYSEFVIIISEIVKLCHSNIYHTSQDFVLCQLYKLLENSHLVHQYPYPIPHSHMKVINKTAIMEYEHVYIHSSALERTRLSGVAEYISGMQLLWDHNMDQVSLYIY